MPFRYAHLYVLALFPLVGLAFWRGYFSDLTGAPVALHVHGITASLWIALVAFQNWTIQNRRNALHRSGGLGVFVVLPLFTAGGLLVMQTMAIKFATQADPFNGAFGARLGLVDAVATMAVPGFVLAALAHRRQVRLHAGYMLATVLLVLSPVLGRLFPLVPGFPMDGFAGRHPFELAFHASQLIAIAIAVALGLRAGRSGRPFYVAAGLIGLQSVLFETLGRSALWEGSFMSIGEVAPAMLAAGGIAATTIALRAGWGRASASAPSTA